MTWPNATGYATESDVTFRLPAFQQPLSSTSRPTLAAVQQFLIDATQLIDSRLFSLGYAPPYNGTNASAMTLAVLKLWCAIGAAGQAEMSIEQQAMDSHVSMPGRKMWNDFRQWLSSDDSLNIAMGQGDLMATYLDDGLGNVDPDTGGDKAPYFTARMPF